MDTTENNKLIAEFMGAKQMIFKDGTKGHSYWHTENEKSKFPDGSSNYWMYDKGYHSSWDWLMPVVEKINKQGYNAEGLKIVKKIAIACGAAHKYHSYKAVVEFIKWYNQNNEGLV